MFRKDNRPPIFRDLFIIVITYIMDYLRYFSANFNRTNDFYSNTVV